MGKKYTWQNIIFLCQLLYQDFFFLIHAFTCILSICIPHVAISKTKENCMSIFLMNGNIMFGNDKQDN